MAGRIVNILQKTAFSQTTDDNKSSVFAAGPRAISSSDWRSGVLSVRIHSVTTWGSTATLTISVTNAFISPDDPSILFLDPINKLAQIVIDGSTIAAGAVFSAQLDDPIGPMLAVNASVNAGAAGDACTWEMSIDLVGRDT